MSEAIDAVFVVLMAVAVLYYISAIYHLDKGLMIKVGLLRLYINKLAGAATGIAILIVLFAAHRLMDGRADAWLLMFAINGFGMVLSGALRWRAAQRIFDEHADDEVIPCSRYR